MSSRETAMTLWYWEQRGGILIEEFLLVRRAPDMARRLIDGLIILGPERQRLPRGARDVDITGKDVVAIQAKNRRLGMYLMGQALFTAKLLERLNPRSIESVALCAADDAVMRPLLEEFEGCRVVVCPEEVCQGLPSLGFPGRVSITWNRMHKHYMPKNRYNWLPFLVNGQHLTFTEHVAARLEGSRCSFGALPSISGRARSLPGRTRESAAC